MVSKQGEGVSFMKALEEVRDATKNVSKSKVDVILNELQETNTEMYEELREEHFYIHHGVCIYSTLDSSACFSMKVYL